MAETSAPSEDSFKDALEERLQAVHVEVEDISGGCGQAFMCLVVSPQFEGLSSLKRHRLVNTALKQEIAQIHAWTARCRTPEEWEAEQAKEQAAAQAATAAAAEAVSHQSAGSAAPAEATMEH